MAAVLGGPATSQAVGLVHERSAGNPLYIRELVLATRESGEWHRATVGDDEAWDWEAGTSTTARLNELLGERLDQLSEPEREALLHIAFGEPLGLGELQAVTTDEVIDSLERSGLITADVDRRRLHVRFTHPMHADVLRRSVGALRARAIRATLANVLAATGARRREDDMRLATLALDAGVEVDVAVLRRAARIALFGNDRHLAIRLAREAFDREPDFEGGHALADALYEEGTFAPIGRALDHLGSVVPHDRATGDRGDAPGDRALLPQRRRRLRHGVLDALLAEVTSGPWHDEALALRATLLTISDG